MQTTLEYLSFGADTGGGLERNAYAEFLARLKLLVSQHPILMINTLSNIFTMRLIGNKTHGDLGEIAIAEFIKQFMYDYDAKHVGKDLFRAKSHEEDISVISLVTSDVIPLSLKAYGDGPLQLSTDKNMLMFPLLESFGVSEITDSSVISSIFRSDPFTEARALKVLPLIYREKAMECNILVFDFARAFDATAKIERLSVGSGRKHAVWRFVDAAGRYICEVRYGGASANALQRGLWTHTRNGERYFDSITNGWIEYSHNHTLVELFAKALNATPQGHEMALEAIDRDLIDLKKSEGLPW